MDLSTTYLGLALKNPLVPSASPLSQEPDNVRRLEDAGAAALVMHSLFEEQITHESHQLDHYLSYFTDSGDPNLPVINDVIIQDGAILLAINESFTYAPGDYLGAGAHVDHPRRTLGRDGCDLEGFRVDRGRRQQGQCQRRRDGQ